jgi:hypothetical protein
VIIRIKSYKLYGRKYWTTGPEKILQNAVPASQEAYYVSIININQLMPFMEINAVYSEIEEKHINKLQG